MSESKTPKTLKDSLEAAANKEKQRRDESGGYLSTTFFGWIGRLSLLGLATIPPWFFGSVGAGPLYWISISILVGLGTWWLDLSVSRPRSQVLPHVLWFVVLGVILGFCQTMPLPNWMSGVLSGKQGAIYSENLQPLAGASQVTPTYLSIDVEATWKQLRLLFLAAVGLLLGSQFFRRTVDMVLLLTAVMLNGVALSTFGILQKLTDNGKIYWVYELSLGGTPFGPYVNRNNSAGYLLLCLGSAIGLLTYLWQADGNRGPGLIVSKEIPIWRQIREHIDLLLAELNARKLGVLFAIVIIAAGVISGLSRGGVSAMLVGTLITTLFFGMARKPRAGGLLLLPLLAGVFLLTSWIGFYDQLMERFNVAEAYQEDSRLKTWSETSASIRHMGILGSGLGSYPTVHRLYSSLPETGIFEYAENQYVQSLVDAGIPGFILLVGATILFVYSMIYVLYRGSSPLSVAVGTMGLFVGTTQVIASLFDFGWYIPANTMLASILVGALSYQSHSFATRLKKKSVLQWQPSFWVTSCLALTAFCLALMVTFNYHQAAESERNQIKGLAQLDRDTMTLPETEDRLAQLQPLATTVSDFNQLGDLYLRRSKLLLYETLSKDLKLNESDAGQKKILDRLWNLATLNALQETVSERRLKLGNSAVNQFRNERFVNECLTPAANHFMESLRRRPLQPEVLLKLGEIISIINDPTAGSALVEQAVAMSPNNVQHRIQAAITLLYNGNRDRSLPHLRRVLELDQSKFIGVIQFLQGRTDRLSEPLSDEIITQKVLPDDPRLIYAFVIKYLPSGSDLRVELLDRAFELVNSQTIEEIDVAKLKANILLENGRQDEGIRQLEIATVNNPADQESRFRLAKLLLETGNLDGALKQANRLTNEHPASQMYKDLVRRVLEATENKRNITNQE